MSYRFAFKLMRQRKDGTLGPLFINRKQRIVPGVKYKSEYVPTKGYAPRMGWHCCEKPYAPHLSTKGRVWAVVCIKDYQEMERPESQGGLWYIADEMEVVCVL